MIEWLDLEIEQDGDAFVGYEALSDNRCEGDWPTIRQWIGQLLEDIEEAMEEAQP